MRWPPFKHVFFDCDSTLTSVEGIDVLASSAGKGWRVSVLTRAAMDGELPLEEIYGKRLNAVRPTRGQIISLVQQYKRHVVPDADQVISALQFLGHKVYIISGGLEEPVAEFGLSLSVPRENIRAVEIQYDRLSGEWWRTDQEPLNPEERYLDFEHDPLTLSPGKAQLIQEMIGDEGGRSLLVGDGASDLFAQQAVDLFVGFGGVVRRPQVEAEAPIYINSKSLAPLLIIAAGPAGLRRLKGTPYAGLEEKIVRFIDEDAISFGDQQLERKFERAYERSH